MKTSISSMDQIADWVWRVGFDDLPDTVVQCAKRHLKDGIGVALAASNARAVEKTIEHFVQDAGKPSCSLVTGRKIQSPSQAALVNGMAAHFYDFDDTSFLGIVHGTAAIWPAAMAMVQGKAGTGEDLLLAFIVGSEALYCLGDCLGNDLYGRGWWSSATLGIFGAAAAAAKAAHLNREQTRNALRLASVHAFGTRSVFGGESKPFLLGRAAQAGVDCAQFGLANLSVPENTFEGTSGFVDTLNSGQFDPAPLQTLGTQFRLVDPGVAIKLYPICSAAQAATEAVLELIQLHKIPVEDITRIELRVTNLVAMQLRYKRANTMAEAQFCLPFAVASIVSRQQLGIDQLSEPYIRSGPIQSLMTRIEMIADDTILDQTDDPAAAPESAHVYIYLKSGEILDRYNPMATGMPGKAIPDAQLDLKFTGCAGQTRQPRQVSALKEYLLNLEKRTDLHRIFDNPDPAT